ncbi:hypothetical protein ACGFNV_35710 [Streptomyces sp. NPDC048751]
MKTKDQPPIAVVPVSTMVISEVRPVFHARGHLVEHRLPGVAHLLP